MIWAGLAVVVVLVGGPFCSAAGTIAESSADPGSGSASATAGASVIHWLQQKARRYATIRWRRCQDQDHGRRASRYVDRKEYPTAEDIYRQVVKAEPNNVDALKALASVLYREDQA